MPFEKNIKKLLHNKKEEEKKGHVKVYMSTSLCIVKV